MIFIYEICYVYDGDFSRIFIFLRQFEELDTSDIFEIYFSSL